MKRPLALSALLFLMSVSLAYAGDSAPSYVELADAPTIAVDWAKGTTQSATLGGNRTFTFLNGKKGEKYTLILRQDATGSRTVTWPASVRWPGTYPLTLTSTANKTDYICFFYNGVSYDGIAAAQGF